MGHSARIGLVFALLGAAGAGAMLLIPATLSWLILIPVLGLAWLLVNRLLLAPAALLAREVAILAQTKGTGRAPIFPERHLLGDLLPAIEKLALTVSSSQGEFNAALDKATRQSEEQRRWLEVILVDLAEGVLVCNLNHQLLLYNQTATRLFGKPEAIGLGRPLFALVSKAAILHTLDLLDYRRRSGVPQDGDTLPFVCATADAKRMLEGRMGLILDPAGKTSAYVLTFTDMSERVAELERADTVRHALTRDLRQPMANLRAASETLNAYPLMEAGVRQSFEKVILEESTRLSNRLDELALAYRGHGLGRWPMGELHAADLIDCLDRRLVKENGPRVTLIGMPLWLQADHHLLMRTLLQLVRKIAQRFAVEEIDAETKLGDKRVYLDLIWKGAALSNQEIEAWIAEPLEGGDGPATIAEALERHGAEIWSQPSGGDYALLRLPLLTPMNARILVKQEEERPPARPEFYDFGLLAQHADVGSLAERPLSQLTFVVFDTETTGLKPSQGDEIISIGAVRVVNGRLLSGETFERLVNPGMKIPEASIRFHHITDSMVADKPPIAIVLPQFKGFAGDAVLAAHNAAFDLKFLHLKEASTGIRFTNPVVDTLLLSRLADEHLEDHSLDGVALRFNIDIPDRHTALGDALATAVVLVRLIQILETQGITTLGQVMRLTNMAAQMRATGQNF
ncbi:MAG: histidine kinase [Alphaproteobacteria bacterium]|nr:histidine kinase [Alphaproteobacteria bacterium]